MDYSIFNEFVALAETESYAEVSDRLFISESTLARHIRMMELELGVNVFDRTAKGIRLNCYGEAFLPYAKEAVEIWEKCVQELEEKKQQDYNLISILCGYNIVDWLIAFHRQEEDAVLNVMDEGNDRKVILQRLRSGSVHFAVTDLIDQIPEDVTAIPLDEYSYQVIVPKRHRIAQLGKAELGTLKQEGLIDTFRKEPATDSVLVDYFRHNGFSPHIIKHVETFQQIICEVAAGNGIAIGRWTKDDKIFGEDVALVPLEPKLTVKSYLCYLKKRELRPIEQKFVEFIKQNGC